MQAQDFTIETTDRSASIVTNPRHNVEKIRELHRRLTQAEGWIHFEYGVTKFSKTKAGAAHIAAEARRRLQA
jgi:hypothetical protein